MLLQTIRTVFAPHTIAFLCKLCAIIAIVGFATGGFTTGLMLNVYIYAARAWVPERSYYERPLFFEYNNTAAMASVTFIKWHKTPDGYSVSPERVEFLKSREKVNINLQLTLPESSENEALFQLHSFLKSDSDAVLHTLQRPLSLPHRSPIVRTMRRIVLFPFFLIDWFQWVFAFFRLSPLLNVAMLITATALMLLSSAAAMCSCILCIQVVAEFWQESGSSGARSEPGSISVPTASPLSHPDGSVMEPSGAFRGFRSRRSVDRDAMHGRGPHVSGPHTLGSDAERVRHSSWDGSDGEGGDDRGLREALNTIAEERAASEGSQEAHRDALCESDAQFRYRVKAAVQRGTADYYSRLAAPEGSWAARGGFLGGAWGAPSGASSTPAGGGVTSGGLRARKGARKVYTGSDASTSSGASGGGMGAEHTLEIEPGRDDQLHDPEAEIQPAGQKFD